MNKNKTYSGIDCFRLIAAFLVVAIHTSPLASYHQMGDFILTRIIGRVAVPFFFLTTGFFLISRYQYNNKKLKVFLKKTSVIYMISILIYIPLNIYNQYFTMNYLLPNVIKDILFDGTIYHLWYLPASMMGGIIAWFGVKKLGYKKAFMVAGLLYLIGLFGDSYYGVARTSPFLESFYTSLFQISDYTRNGIFFAPIFFLMGGSMADQAHTLSKKNSIIGFLLSLFLMLLEGLLLHQEGLQRHDSMYIFLVPCMYFLFSFLLTLKGSSLSFVRTPALIIYIIHPLVIVMVRMLGKLFKLEKVLIGNSLIHYGMVSIGSAILSILLCLVFNHIKRKKKKVSSNTKDRAWVEINLKHLEHNVKTLKGAMSKDCELMAVVKAKAYGHDDFFISTHLSRMGIRAFAVATIEEGIALRRYGVIGEILIFGYTNPERARELHKYDLTQTLLDSHYAHALNRQKVRIKAHIKIDTGMHRLGFGIEETENIRKAFQLQYLQIKGIYTHLCVSDRLIEEDICFTKEQIDNFYQLLEELKQSGIKIPKTHIQSSYGLLNYPELSCDYVRAGISLYGVLSSFHDKTKLNLDLRPVLSLKSNVVLIRTINKGESVGYGRTFFAEKDSTIAIVPVGYADGYPRELSCQKGKVIINGYLAPIIGRICMDQMAVDITEIPNVAIGTRVTLIGEEKNIKILAPEVANWADTISNELLSRIGDRVLTTV